MNDAAIDHLVHVVLVLLLRLVELIRWVEHNWHRWNLKHRVVRGAFCRSWQDVARAIERFDGGAVCIEIEIPLLKLLNCLPIIDDQLLFARLLRGE